jgi:hypothetical protein
MFLEEAENNFTIVKKIKTASNKTIYDAIVSNSLTSVSCISETAIVNSELNSTSQPQYS